MKKLIEFGRKALFYVRVLSAYEERQIRSYRLQIQQRLQQRLLFAVNHFEQLRIFTTFYGNCQHSRLEALQLQIVDALHTGERSKASTLLSELSRTSEALKATDFAPILKKCARLPDPLFALETWKLMKDNHIYGGGNCYFYTVQALSKGGYLQEAFNLMSLLAENPHLYPLLPVYNNFLSVSLQNCNIDYVNDCLDRMEQHLIGKSEITYTELLKLAVLQQNLSAVREIWKECIQYYTLSLISLRKFVWSFSMLRDVGSANVALQHMVALAFQRKSILRETAEGKFVNLSLDIPIPSRCDVNVECFSQNNGFLSSASGYHDNLNLHTESPVVQGVGLGIPGALVSRPAKNLLRWSFGDVIHACAKTGRYILAEQLMSQMQNLGLEPSSGTYDGYLRAVVRARGFLVGVEVIKVMREKSIMPSDSLLAFMSASCIKGRELDLAESFLEQISKCTSLHPLNALLEACDVLDQPERAIRVLAKMNRLNLQPDIRTYELLFSLFGNVNAPYEKGDMLSGMVVSKRMNAIETDMMKNGVQHSPLSFRNMIKALGREGMIEELNQYVHLAERPNSSLYELLGCETYNTVLHSIAKTKQVHMAAAVFRVMKLFRVSPDAGTYHILLDCCSIGNCYKSGCAILSMMIRDGFSPDTLAYTTLIKILVRLKEFDEALWLFNKGIFDGIEPDLVLYNIIINVAGKKERIDVVEFIVEQMHRKKIQPDSSTCRLVFCAYVEMGRYSTALEALQVMSLRVISEDDHILARKKRDFGHLMTLEVKVYLEDFLDEKSDRMLTVKVFPCARRRYKTKILRVSHDELRRIDRRRLVMFEEHNNVQNWRRLFKEGKEDVALALMYLRWCSMSGASITWLPNKSEWAIRLSNDYELLKLPS